MGCDGGTIPKRHELVKTAKRPEQKDKDMDRSAKWSNCVMSQQSLTMPIVTCELGKLYSKESVLEFLLDRTICDNASHIRNLKDVKLLKLTPNPGYEQKSSEKADQYHDTQASEYVCPIVGLEMNGKYKFCALWTCGCVLSERALKEVDSDTCHNCGIKFEKDDVIMLNPDGDDVEKMEANMRTRREKLKALRKDRKEKKKKGEKRKLEVAGKPVSNDRNGFKEPAPRIDKEIAAKKVKTNGEVNGDSGSSSKIQHQKAAKKSNETNGKIDPTKSKVFKSLFTSSEDNNRSKDKTAHWITYNPYHL